MIGGLLLHSYKENHWVSFRALWYLIQKCASIECNVFHV